jgi:hypothetical protein
MMGAYYKGNSESTGLYGSSSSFGGTYFEWFIFQEATTAPATPTGGSWSFTTNVGTPPTGWFSTPPASPTNIVWVSIALVNSRNANNLTWSAPGRFSVSGTGTVTAVTGTSPVASSGGATPAISLSANYGDTQNPYSSKTAKYFLAAPNGSAGVPTFRAIVASDIPTLNQNTTGTAANVTGIVAVANGGTGTTTPSLVAGTNVTITGTWPNQRINSSGGGGGTPSQIVNPTTLNSLSLDNVSQGGMILSGIGNIAISRPDNSSAGIVIGNGDFIQTSDYGIAIGYNSGVSNYGTAIGYNSTADAYSLTLGYAAQASNGGTAIGQFSGSSGGIAIGSGGVTTGAGFGAIVLNASGTLNPSGSGLYIGDLRNNSNGQTAAGNLQYDTTTKEIFYAPVSTGGMTLLATVTPASGVTFVNITGLASSKQIVVFGNAFTISSASTLRLKISVDNGSTFPGLLTIFSNSSTTPTVGIANIYNANINASKKSINFINTGGNIYLETNSGLTAGTINAVRVETDGTATFTGTGTFYVYGIN